MNESKLIPANIIIVNDINIIKYQKKFKDKNLIFEQFDDTKIKYCETIVDENYILFKSKQCVLYIVYNDETIQKLLDFIEIKKKKYNFIFKYVFTGVYLINETLYNYDSLILALKKYEEKKSFFNLTNWLSIDIDKFIH